ncbi:hypothetical protein PA10_00123 [Pseudomonas phage pPa_SNUABM_DT01]|nr:hypothetical protein PA10_00123 [Pseudomonas phage pPa_SNUABM_DT01]
MGRFLFGVLCGLGLAAYIQSEKEKAAKKATEEPAKPAAEPAAS